MELDDPRIEVRRIHGQDVYLPSREAWAILVDGEPLAGLDIPVRELVREWLRALSHFEVVRLGLTRLRGRWHLVPLLRQSDRWYRVHFEDVSCDHCQQRCGWSAAPDTVAYAGTALTTPEIFEAFAPLGIRACPHCGAPLRRRHTVWLATPPR
jgi:hypothetical protein